MRKEESAKNINDTILELKEIGVVMDERFLTSREKPAKSLRCVVFKILIDRHDANEICEAIGIKKPCLYEHVREFKDRYRASCQFRDLYNEYKLQ